MIMETLNLQELKEKYPEIAKMTVEQVVDSNEFKHQFQKAVTTIRNARHKLLDALDGQLKRNIYDRLVDKKLLKTEYFCNEFKKCINKESKLPSQLRNFVVSFGNNIYKDTIKQMMKQ